MDTLSQNHWLRSNFFLQWLYDVENLSSKEVEEEEQEHSMNEENKAKDF